MPLKKAQLKDLDSLQQICIDAYSLNFHHHWNPGGLEWFVEREFGMARLTSDLTNEAIGYYFIIDGDTPVGFVKLREVPYEEHGQPDVMELEKIYIRPDIKGKGIGRSALAAVIAMLKGQGKKVLFLGVIDTNYPAITFYEKFGFEFHSKSRLELPYFKEELKGLNRMRLGLSDQ